VHPKIVSEHNDVILKCIDDDDVSIRYRALDLLVGMVTKKNLPDVVRKLLSQLDSTHVLSSDPAYRTEMVKRIVELSAQNSYQHVTDFEWFINVLVVRFFLLCLPVCSAGEPRTETVQDRGCQPGQVAVEPDPRRRRPCQGRPRIYRQGNGNFSFPRRKKVNEINKNFLS